MNMNAGDVVHPRPPITTRATRAPPGAQQAHSGSSCECNDHSDLTSLTLIMKYAFYDNFTTDRAVSWLTTWRVVLGAIPGPVKLDTVSPTTRHRCDVSSELCSRCLTATMDPTRFDVVSTIQ